MAIVNVSNCTLRVLNFLVAKVELPTLSDAKLMNAADYRKYSSDWSQGGSIIEREGICIDRLNENSWCANHRKANQIPWLYADSPLVAAMRCYVVSKLGESVDVPDELLEGSN